MVIVFIVSLNVQLKPLYAWENADIIQSLLKVSVSHITSSISIKYSEGIVEVEVWPLYQRNFSCFYFFFKGDLFSECSNKLIFLFKS